jgi:hypothetical protein
MKKHSKPPNSDHGPLMSFSIPATSLMAVVRFSWPVEVIRMLSISVVNRSVEQKLAEEGREGSHLRSAHRRLPSIYLGRPCR